MAYTNKGTISFQALDLELLFPILTSWIVLLLSMLVIPLLGRFFDWDRKTIGCLLLTAGLETLRLSAFLSSKHSAEPKE